MMCHGVNFKKKWRRFIFSNWITTPVCNTMNIGIGHMIQNITCKLTSNVNMFIIKHYEYSIKYLNINWVGLLIVLPPTNLSIFNNEFFKKPLTITCASTLHQD